ncbi:hypothetical protein [Pseudomonas aeruginosa]
MAGVATAIFLGGPGRAVLDVVHRAGGNGHQVLRSGAGGALPREG